MKFFCHKVSYNQAIPRFFLLVAVLLFSEKGFSEEPSYKNETLFITGIAGFIGFHTAIEAKSRGYTVFGIDNFNDYYDPNLKEARAAILEENGIEVIRGDLCDKELMTEIYTREINGIIHLAGQAGVRASFETPKAYIDSNIVGTWILLELNRNKKIPMVVASSSSVYGEQTCFPISETSPADLPLSLYAATKKATEEISHAYHSMYNIPITCLRFFSVYGPWGRPDMAYYSFSKKIRDRVPISIYGDGKLLRDMTYIDDIVAGIFLSFEKVNGFHIYNLGCSQPHTITEMVTEIEKSLGIQAQVISTSKPSADANKTHADISKIQRDLGYAPKVFLQEGMSRFISWFQEYENQAR